MLTTITQIATIANGASLSSAIACDPGWTLAAIQMPSSWTTANLTFALSTDNSTFNNFTLASDGSEYTVNAAASRYIRIPVDDFRGAMYLKVRSGTSGSAVNQGGDRAITLVFAKVNY